MTCNAYSYFNPNGWLCGAADALGKGLTGGLANGLGDGIEKATSQAATNLSNALKKLFENAAEELSQMSPQELGDKVGTKFNELISSSLKGFDLANLSILTGDEFTKAWDQGFQNLNMAQRIDNLGKEISPAIHRLMEIFRENTIKELDHLRDDIQQVITNTARDSVLKTLPWILLGIVLTTAAPLGVTYAYYKMKHNIGKPKLIQESNTTNITDKIYNNSINASWALYSGGKNFLKGYIYTAAGLIIGSALASLASFGQCLYNSGLNHTTPCYDYPEPKSTYSDYYPYKKIIDERYYERLNGFTPPIFNTKIPGDLFSQALGDGSNQSQMSIMDYAPGFYLPLAVGTALATYSIGLSIYRGITSHLKKNEKPIFNTSTQEAVDDIISSTKHCKKHGGFFENLILYGPGGTGKTMISKFIAKNTDMNYIMMSGGDLAQHIRRKEHVTELNKLFMQAKNSSGQTIIFIDEAEALCKDRSLFKDDEHIELLDAFLNHTGEPDCAKKIMLILATNRLTDIDAAVLSRMDHKIAVNPPELEQRAQILELHANKFFSKSELLNFFSKDQLLKLAKATEGFTGRDLFKLLNMIANKKAATEKNILSQDLIEKMITRFVNQENEAKNLVIKKLLEKKAAAAA